MWTVLKLIIGLAAIYGVIVGVMAWRQRDMMYFPDTRHVAPDQVGLTGFDEVELVTGDGQTLIAWHHGAPPGAATILTFHGNGGSIALRASRYEGMVRAGFGVLALSYRGYGGSTGTPHQAGLIADGFAAYDWLAQRVNGPVVLHGESLGSAIALQVAGERPVAGLVLEAAATSILDVARRAYPWLPVRLLLADQYRSDLIIDKVRAPLLMIHGTRDRIVPFELGQRLFALANQPKRMIAIDGAGHNDLWRLETDQQTIRFIRDITGGGRY
jgi:fermentation-respiration switch protein FrsA (DUF1100 family)